MRNLDVPVDAPQFANAHRHAQGFALSRSGSTVYLCIIVSLGCEVVNLVNPSRDSASGYFFSRLLLLQQERTQARMVNSGTDGKSQSVAKVLGRMMIGVGIAVAGVSIGTGIAVGLYYVGRGIERHGNRSSAETEALRSETNAKTNVAEYSTRK